MIPFIDVKVVIVVSDLEIISESVDGLSMLNSTRTFYVE